MENPYQSPALLEENEPIVFSLKLLVTGWILLFLIFTFAPLAIWGITTFWVIQDIVVKIKHNLLNSDDFDLIVFCLGGWVLIIFVYSFFFWAATHD